MYFLQSSDAYARDLGSSAASTFVYIILWLLGMIILASLFRVDRRVKNQQAEIFLLTQLWKKNGATDEEIKKFRNDFKIK